ncbi:MULTISPECIES: RNA-binding cell elongation regulator Jag/EloR [unclassified Geomicrobium]|uniref:RNA-binding cell elongation regulator Jag/EloR n=1 Tax=unclassified Geomicrobium TaxID=2628951 RepID=UPI00045ED3D0|nr:MULTISPECIES: RNA-binding cell elongation regulator Jag/EloR [unclassified Geomicrobium]GAJ97188.1 RNA-binding protein Jag [Geomicrobium sp. JCM 19055]GAK06913.1 RNA-binding protein Jag [Geomicrobium sp. JCM 19038]
MKTISVSGKTIEEALENGLTQLDVNREQVNYVEIQSPTKGFLGLFSKPAILEITVKPDPFKEAKTFLEDVLKSMNVTLTVTVEKHKSQEATFDIQGKDVGVIIGKRGQTLESLQYLTNLAANRHSSKYVRITLDAENYRERRQQTLENLALRLAHKAKKTKRKVVLEPMQAKERKLIHQTLQKDRAIETTSDGKEPHRHVIIAPKVR